jgi:DNA-binding MarR family transcriptional regulator
MPQNNDENVILKKLTELGLNEKESRVYLALLSREYVGTSKLITATGLHSQYVYDGLAGLEQKGLVHHVIQNGRKRFAAQTPKHLEMLVQEKRRVVDALVPQLLSLSGKRDLQTFEVYQGNESCKMQDFRMLESVHEGSSFDIIGDEGRRFFELMGDDMEVYEAMRVEKKIHLRHIISPDNAEETLRALQRPQYFEMRTMPKLAIGHINTLIWEDFISLHMFGEPVTTFVLTNKEVAQSYRNFFEALWATCDEVK